MEQQIITRAEKFVREFFAKDASGHDAWHTFRVRSLALRLAEMEGADPLTVELAALLHDVDDRKLSPQTHETLGNAVGFLRKENVEEARIGQICAIIRALSFSSGLVPESLEGRVVQDADRLDAIGAIGIARTFAYGGAHGRAIHLPEEAARPDLSREEYAARASTGINHFYEKLLLLKDLMNTASARRMAEARHRYMLDYLEEFQAEWEGRR
ncbi:MAG: HD domain-containing protein [Deltaproteobacteria bacterium]|nr:HD domain-containing protein [Deltaproteobacteria bacterium]